MKNILYLTPKHRLSVSVGSGTGLTLSIKDCVAMKLPGIKLSETPSRLYPNGNLLHIIGLAQPQKSGTSNLICAMGIEAYFDKRW